MILIGLGANLPSPAGAPQATLVAALAALGEAGIVVVRRSRWYRTSPVPRSDQPPYVNAVADVATSLAPASLLRELHAVEARFGRVRGERDAARTLDLDLLAYGDVVMDLSGGVLLPHPRLHERAFVLLPLAEVAPQWRHPLLGRSVGELLAAVPTDQEAVPL